ncbi:MAG: hypothetical protein KME43_18035 [Myxacorys chilensis ATA2-1-KO14]|jgi:hypothetical protein|nr:hypothetical protein [Myxacorys chilensis ATA2-1-KO14]
MRSICTDERSIRSSTLHRLGSTFSSAIALTIVTSFITQTSQNASANPAILPLGEYPIA